MYSRQKQPHEITEVRWNSRLQMVVHGPKRPQAWKGVLTAKIQGCHSILPVKFYTRPTKYKPILLRADSEKSNR